MIKVVLIDGELFEEWKGHRVPVHWEKVWDYLFDTSWYTNTESWEIDQSVKDHIEILGNLSGKEKPIIQWLASSANSSFSLACVTAQHAPVRWNQKAIVSAYQTFPGLKNAGKARTRTKKSGSKKGS